MPLLKTVLIGANNAHFKGNCGFIKILDYGAPEAYLSLIRPLMPETPISDAKLGL